MRHIEQWLSGMLMLLMLLTACASESTEEPVVPKHKPKLKVYLFAPESPIITRADIGQVDASDPKEKSINTLDVWVFEHEAPNHQVSYIHLDNLTFDGQKEIAMDISDDFANMPKKPNVDIYVLANKESCGLITSDDEAADPTTNYNGKKTLAQLKEAYIGQGYFGVSAPQQTVPITNLNIKLNENVIPQEEYLFLEGVYPTYKSHVKSTGNNDYEAAATLVHGEANVQPTINACSDPASYAYTTETGQAYETKINDGIGAGELSQVGLFYLRESHRQLTGTIEYTIGTSPNTENKSVPFTMAGAGDFTRNHTWIVYGYFLGSGELKLNVVDVKGCTTGGENQDLYIW